MKSKKKLWIRFVIIMAFAVLFLLFALFAGKFAPYDPLETHYTDLLKAPCKQYLMGTDQMGRDIFSRILYGKKNITFDRICCDSDHFRCRNSYRDNSRLLGRRF